jgi:nitrate reductase gamma subunit
METWLEWARGPLFRACLAIMILGVIRVIFLNTLNIVLLIRESRKNGRSVPWGTVFRATLAWLFPGKKSVEQRALFSLTSMIFHVTIIVTPILLGAHILLWERGLGLSWPAIGNLAADYLTIVACITGVALFVQRLVSRASRALSRPQDYLLPLLIVIPFASGFLAMHPAMNPFDYSSTMFVHVMSGNLIFLLIPFSKLSHVALFPAAQLVSELGWHLKPGSGEMVAVALGKENEPI